MKIQFDGAGDVIVVTGGANGIGAALALACVRAGAMVVVCDVDVEAGQQFCTQHGNLDFRQLDVGNRDAVLATFAEIETTFGRIDGLVCGAAIQPRVVVHDTSATLWRSVIDVNLNGVVWCYQSVIPGMMKRRRGSIIAFTSGLATTGWPGASAYAASKAALVAFVKSVAKEVATHRVRVNLIAPGVIDTPQYRKANPGADGAHWASTTGIGTADDVVGPLMFLLSDAATMTASVLSRDFVYPVDDAGL